MKNKTDRVPYPYYTLGRYLRYQLETLTNTYRRKKEKAFFNQCRYAKKKSQENRYKMNCSFLECSEYKHKIRQVEEWIKDLDKERDIATLEKENRQLKQQIEKMKSCDNCKHRYYENGINYCNNRCQKNLYNNWELAE